MFKDENRHYSLRKLSVGLASVLIGISFASNMNGSSVKADAVKSGSNDAQTVKVNDTVAKDSNTAAQGSDAVVKADAESASEGQNQTPEAVKKDSGAITQDIKQKAVKASEAVAKLQNNAVKDNSDAKNTADDSKAIVKGTAESTSKGTNLAAKQQNTAVQGSDAVGDKASKSNNSSVVQEDSSAKGDNLADKNKALKAKAEAAKKAAALFRLDSSETALNLNGTNAIDPKTLKENKTEAVVKADPARGIDPVKFASNGGFDPKIWGTMDTSKWQLDNNGNITGYTGDMSHIIIPNASDFAKAGKSYSQIGISSDKMKKLGSNAKTDTLTISLTDNKKVKATNANWVYVFTRSELRQANLEGLDTSNVTNMSCMFNNASSLTNLDVSKWDTGNVTNMDHMFDGASSLKSLDVSKWDTGNVTDMSWMFYGASSLTNLDVSNWNTGKVTDMDHMFDGASGLTSLDVSNWNTGKVTDMDQMFYGASGLTSLDVSNWDTRNVTDMNTMFCGASNLNSLDVSKWDTSNVTDMRDMFGSARSLTSLDVSNWDTSNVTKMAFMFDSARSLTSLDVSNWDTSNVTNMNFMFDGASGLTSLDVSKWDTSKVTSMYYMFGGASSLTGLDVSNWDTSKVTNMSNMFMYASSLKNLDVLNWDTSKVTDMSGMFWGARSLKNLDVSNWDTGKVTNMRNMFWGARSLALIINGDKFADYLVNHDGFTESNVNSSVKSVTTDNAKLLQLLTNDVQHNSATRTIVLTFPANYSPDLTKYHLTKTGNTYQIKQSVDYDKPYLQGTVLINATKDITEHHIDTTKQIKLSDTWQPNYDKLVLAHKNSDGSVSFDAIQLPKVPGYKTVASLVNPAKALFAVSFMALPKPVASAINDTKPAKTVTPATPVAIEVAKPIKTEPKVAVTPKAIDLSTDVVATAPNVSAWQVAEEPDQDTYQVSNGKYAVELPHISNAQLHVIANDSTKDSVLFAYKGQNTKYVFKIKFANRHYLLTTYEIKSGKLVKLIDYNFIKSSKMIDIILDWINLK